MLSLKRVGILLLAIVALYAGCVLLIALAKRF
jgi:hypothetical protein